MRREPGDTLVEVLIAVAILAAAVVAGLGIMNFGFGVILNSIERTQVQANISTQLSLVQYSRDDYLRKLANGASPTDPSVWRDVITNATGSYSDAVCDPATKQAAINAGRNPFYMTYTGAQGVEYTQYSPSAPAPTTVATAGSGLWVEAVRPTPTTNYVDIYAKACWNPAAGAIAQESKSVLRLYVGEAATPVAVVTLPPTPVTCSVLANFNYIENGDFAIGAGNGPGIVPAARFASDLPNRGPDVYPDDAGLNNAPSQPWYTGGFSIQSGEKIYQAGTLHGRPFPGDPDPSRNVGGSNTYFYSNPNQTLSQPRGTVTNFTGVLWRQTITGLAPNATYDFSIYIDNLLVFPGATDPQIRLLADGTPLTALQLDGVPTGSDIVVPRLPDRYRRVSLLFTTGPAQSTSTLEVYDTANAINGDDFAMTMMALRRCIA